jgi:rod shape-determining protein MreD
VKAAVGLLAITLSLALQSTVDRVLPLGAASIDLVLVAVVYVALTSGPVGGMLAGSVAGLIQDSLGTGIVGIGGLAKLIVGFFAGVFGQQFIVTPALPRLAMFIGATVVHAAVFMGLYQVLGLRTFESPWAAVGTQALTNAAVGMVAFAIIEAVPGAIERRRMTRRGRH